MQANAQELEAPLKQFKQGIPVSEIKCMQNYQLILKKSDKTPACVFPSTVSILIKRGWADIVNTTIETSSKGNTTQTQPPVFAMFYISGSNHTNLALFEKYLRPGDYLFITTPLDQDSDFSQLLQDVAEAKNKSASGVNIVSFAWYSKIDVIKLHSAYLPHGVDGIIYDYESGAKYSPEYTTDYDKVLSLFESASEIAHRNGLKLMLAPVFGDIVNNTEIEHSWDWSEISNHTDFLVIQFQHFFKTQNADLVKTQMGKIMKNIDSTSGTPAFVELSLTASGGTADEDLEAMQSLKSVGVNKFLIFFEPWTTNDLEHIFEKRDGIIG